MKKTILNLVLITAFILAMFIPMAIAQDQPAAAPAQPAANINTITQATDKAGMKACSGRINQVANFLTAGTPNVGAMLFLPPNNPDQQLVSISMEIPIKGAAAVACMKQSCTGRRNVTWWPTKLLAHSKRSACYPRLSLSAMAA